MAVVNAVVCQETPRTAVRGHVPLGELLNCVEACPNLGWPLEL